MISAIIIAMQMKALILAAEGLKFKPYIDPGYGVSICYGNQSFKNDNRLLVKLRQNRKLSLADCDNLLIKDIEITMITLNKCSPPWVTFSEKKQQALMLIAYSLGQTKYCNKFPKFRKAISNKNFKLAFVLLGNKFKNQSSKFRIDFIKKAFHETN